jgi:hypothetical protein
MKDSHDPANVPVVALFGAKFREALYQLGE